MRTLSPFEKIGLGLAAGLVGTLVMTLGQKAEMALRDRPASNMPAEAVETVIGIELAGRAETRLATAVHVAYGTALGSAFAALDEMPEPSRTLAFLTGSQFLGMAILQSLDLDGKPSEWDAPEGAIDVGHHLVYAMAAGLAYAGGKALLTRRD